MLRSGVYGALTSASVLLINDNVAGGEIVENALEPVGVQDGPQSAPDVRGQAALEKSGILPNVCGAEAKRGVVWDSGAVITLSSR